MDPQGKRLAALGLAFKGGTDDVRESPALSIIKSLLREGCEIVAYDPAANERAAETLSDAGLTFAGSAYEAAEQADGLLILTDWEEFAELDLARLRNELALSDRHRRPESIRSGKSGRKRVVLLQHRPSGRYSEKGCGCHTEGGINDGARVEWRRPSPGMKSSVV